MFPAIAAMLTANADQDRYLRHAGVRRPVARPDAGATRGQGGRL